jgi:hypothetical protein
VLGLETVEGGVDDWRRGIISELIVKMLQILDYA